MGRRRFIEMAHVVEFVVDAQVRPARAAFPFRIEPVRLAVALANGARGVEIAVALLGGANGLYEVIECSVQGWVGMSCQAEGRAFHDLENVRIIEEEPCMIPRHASGCLAEIVHAPRRFALAQYVGNRDGSIGDKARRPEVVMDGDVRRRYGSDGIVVHRIGLSCG